MKIIIIGSAHPLRGGGITTFNERLTEVLQEGGNNVIIYSFKLQYPSLLFPGKTQVTNEPPPRNIKIKSAINSINPFNWLTIGNSIKRERPDLVIVRYWIPFMGPAFGTILRRIKKNRHTKVISILDNVIPHEKRVGDIAFTKYFLKAVDGFVAMSKDVLNDLRKFTNKPAAYSPHPLYDNYGEAITKDDARKKLGLKKEGRYILFFGFIRKYKGLDILLDAMADERIRQLDIQLIIAGEYYGDKDFYETKIDRLNLRKNVHLFTDFIPNDDVKYYFSAADCIAQPYRTATQSGISQIAYHFEKPMIVTNVGGLSEIVPDGKVGYVTEPDAKSIADAISMFYERNPENIFISAIQDEKKKYSWNYFTEQIFKLYKHIV